MEAQRATDKTEQGQADKYRHDYNEWTTSSFDPGGIVKKKTGEYSLKQRFFDNNSPFIPRCLINHAPPIFVGNLNDPLLWEKMEKWKKENNIA